MPRHFYHRSIVWIALIGQFLAGLGSMPVAAAATVSSPPAMTTHCHDHAQQAMGESDPAMEADAASRIDAPADAGKASATPTGPGAAGAASMHAMGNFPDILSQHHCKNGVCHCACAHVAAALPAPLGEGIAESFRAPLTSLYRMPAAPHPTKVFFRPPI